MSRSGCSGLSGSVAVCVFLAFAVGCSTNSVKANRHVASVVDAEAVDSRSLRWPDREADRLLDPCMDLGTVADQESCFVQKTSVARQKMFDAEREVSRRKARHTSVTAQGVVKFYTDTVSLCDRHVSRSSSLSPAAQAAYCEILAYLHAAQTLMLLVDGNPYPGRMNGPRKSGLGVA